MPSATLSHLRETNLGLVLTARHTVSRMAVAVVRGIGDAIFQSRQRRADREIARYLAQSGGRLTDDIERRMMEQFTSAGFGRH